MDTEILIRKAVSEASSDSVIPFYPASAVSVGEKRKRNEFGESYITGNGGVEHNGDAKPKFNEFHKLREVLNFAVGQTWVLYDTADGMPRLYAHIRKVSSVPGFGLRITYLEPDPDDEKEIQWFEEDLPVSVGKFRLGKNQTLKDVSKFSHIIECNEESNTGHFTVSPRKGETWAIFKNWDIKWSLEPDSHRKCEYQFVEVMSDYADGAGVSVTFLHKAKGFASVFFRMGTGDTDISQILPHSLYRFSHRIPSFKLTGMEGKVVPKDAYELDQAALPETIEEVIVPAHLLTEPTALKSKTEVLCFPREGKVFKTGQIWCIYYGYYCLPLYYCRIQKITLTQAIDQREEFQLHVRRLKATHFPKNVVQFKDKRMPVGCGTFSVMKSNEILYPKYASHQVVPQTSMDGNEYTILPKIGEVWAIYQFWTSVDADSLEKWYDYHVVEVLDDAVDYKVQVLEEVKALEPALVPYIDEDRTTFLRAAATKRAVWDNGSEVIFTVPKTEMLKFSHQIPASRVTKEIGGDLKEFFEADSKALCSIIF
ncbi:hypothetical protein V5N11_013844 [Cardamine amara subsp. amara]|uniref:DUF3444 domain-containing protein n=1 Tax=Cardamine amara subsp. amara TaxID=228776 RepID=A0ABD1ASH3_CARAN